MSETKGEENILGPSSNVIEALRGAKFSEQKHLRKPDGSEITTRLVREGAGMVEFEDRVESQQWAGIFNHIVKTAGAALQLGRLLQLNGQQVDVQLMLDTVMLSHSGRRQYDEATWYPDEVDNAAEKIKMKDTKIGLSSLKDKNLPPELIKMISVHELGTNYPYEATDTWNKRLPMYLDYRISQNAMSLEQRFQDLQRGVEAGRFDQRWVEETKAWAEGVEKELFEVLQLPSYEAVLGNPQNLKHRIDTAIKLGKFSEEETHALRGTKLYKPKSGSDDDMVEVTGLTRDEFLKRLQLYPEDINDKLLQPERWERYIRRLYINDAEQGIFVRLSQPFGSVKDLEKEFPQNTWWGKYAHELYDRRHGVPLHPKAHKQIGIARAIEFYRKIEEGR